MQKLARAEGNNSMFISKICNKSFMFVAFFSVLIFFYPLLFLDQTYYFRDVQAIFYPMKHFLAQSLKSGEIPFWCPLYFCGAPFMSDIQTGVFYLPSLIFLVFSYPLAFNMYIVIHVFLCFCFIYLFAREIGFSIPAAIFSALAYSYGGYVLSSINLLNNLTVITWLPALLWSYYRALKTRSYAYYGLTTFFLCLALLGGEPQLFIFSLGIMFSFGLVVVSKKKTNAYLLLKYNLVFIVILTLILLITLIQWGPTFLDYQHSVRLHGINFSQATEHSLSWDRLRHLLIPVSFDHSFANDKNALTILFPPNGRTPWLLSIYPGFLVCPLALFGIYSRKSRETFFWSIIFLLGILFALGSNTLFYNIFYEIFPFFRFPEKFYFLSNIAIVLLAGYGFDSLMSILKKQKVRTKYLALFIPLVLFADLYTAHSHLNPTYKSEFYQFSDPSLTPVLQDMDLFRVYVDESSFSSHLENRFSLREFQMIRQSLKIPNVGIINNINYVDGRTGMELQYQWVMTEILQQPWPERIKLLQLSNVKYIVSAENLDYQPKVMKYVKRINPILFQIRDDLPRAWMVGKIHPLGEWTLHDYSNRSFDYRSTALGPKHEAVRYKTPYYQEVDKIEYYNNNRIRIEITAVQRGVVVLSEAAYPGWSAKINGKQANIIRLNYLFQGVAVDAGRQQILFEYEPPFFYLFAFISLFTIFVLLLCVYFYQRRKRLN